MSEPKGPKLDIPSDLEAELAGEPDGIDASDDDSQSGIDLESSGRHAAEAQEQPGGDGGAVALAPTVEEFEALRAELEGIKDRHLRALAEHENQRRRLLKDQQDAVNFANENLIKDLLGTVDNLERALSHAQSSEAEAGVDPQNLLEGVQLTLRSLMNVLERFGVEAVDASDAKFDPRHHEAMRQVVTPDLEPGSVVEVYQKGYLLKGRLLRPSLVAVAAPGSGE